MNRCKGGCKGFKIVAISAKSQGHFKNGEHSSARSCVLKIYKLNPGVLIAAG